MSNGEKASTGIFDVFGKAMEAAVRAIDRFAAAWQEEKSVLENRIRELELQVESKDYHIEALKAEGKHQRGGDIAAGLFKLQGSAYVQMPKQLAGTEGVVTLYHEAGWPRN
jgi:hypothetical protein